MKKNKSNLDEFQEKKLLETERNCTKFSIWGLLIVILIQMLMNSEKENVMSYVAGEFIVFLGLTIYLTISTIKQGIWSRKGEPNAKSNLMSSLAYAALAGFFFAAVSYYRYHKIIGSIAVGVFMFVMIFILYVVLYAIFTSIYQKRTAKLEDDDDE